MPARKADKTPKPTGRKPTTRTATPGRAATPLPESVPHTEDRTPAADVTGPKFENETSGFNLIPFASMAGGWLGPLLMFWLYVWGPLRPFHYPGGELLPPLPLLLAGFGIGLAVWWLPASYYQVRAFERNGRLYETLGVRHFRWFVPDGDAANRWRRRSDPAFRIIRNRQYAQAFRHRTELSEKSHLMMLVFGVMSAGFAVAIGWTGWAIYLTAGNVLVNLYPILLQRYTRARLSLVLSREQRMSPTQHLARAAASSPR